MPGNLTVLMFAILIVNSLNISVRVCTWFKFFSLRDTLFRLYLPLPALFLFQEGCVQNGCRGLNFLCHVNIQLN